MCNSNIEWSQKVVMQFNARTSNGTSSATSFFWKPMFNQMHKLVIAEMGIKIFIMNLI
ncbi:uncharacterized protein CELE_R193.6 [Caenorhabditis elegans]|uniref:Uncharacterized protein n=1 Tax=Caenorhabditis elegans TaxID=6239 RepID=A0A5E4LZ95_CAEEL|nr:Uncharacterized protein CELE_R193.6 [Caenorhabditis elegans]VVC12374.1 Uncharacterized protein CELE_R193.6 [Caenorhabditis elegans]